MRQNVFYRFRERTSAHVLSPLHPLCLKALKRPHADRGISVNALHKNPKEWDSPPKKRQDPLGDGVLSDARGSDQSRDLGERLPITPSRSAWAPPPSWHRSC